MKRITMTMLVLSAIAVCSGGVWAQASKKTDLHLKNTRTVSGNYNINDKTGYLWGIYCHQGNIQQSTNNVLSGAGYLNLNIRTAGSSYNSSFYSNSSSGRLNKAGDELEIGPRSYNNMMVSRRIKVFKKEGVCRFLDIYENKTGQQATVNARFRVNFNYGISTRKTNTGKADFGNKNDYGMIVRSGNNSCPLVMFVPMGRKSKIRPTVTYRGSYMEINYNLTIPPNKTMVVATFLKQERDQKKLEAELKKFRAYKYFGDLSSKTVHPLIVNFEASAGGLDVNIERAGHADCVMLNDGTPLFGTINNKSFKLGTPFGEMTLEADKLLGLSLSADGKGQALAVLADGQVISGQIGEQKLDLDIPAAGKQVIPLADLKSFAYCISQDKPEVPPFTGPYLILRSGDRLVYDPKQTPLTLQTSDAKVTLDPESLMMIQFDTRNHNLHRVTFLNGSRLSGLIQPDSLQVHLDLAGKQTINRNQIKTISFGKEIISDDTPLAKLTLANGDMLIGRLVDASLPLKNRYGQVTVNPSHIRSFQTVKNQPGQFRVHLWNKSVLPAGKFDLPALKFKIDPGPEIAVSPEQIASLTQPTALPPDQIRKKVEDLITQLGSESFKDRKAAQDKLIKMGEIIVPILKKNQDIKDPEIRNRIQTILEEFGASAGAGGNSVPGNVVAMPFNGPVQLQRVLR